MDMSFILMIGIECITLFEERHNFCDIGHKYATFELEFCVLAHLLLILLILFVLLGTDEPIFRLVRVELLAAKKNALEEVNRILLVPLSLACFVLDCDGWTETSLSRDIT